MTALDERSKYLRRLIVDALKGGGRGHLGSSMSMVEVLRVLYDSVLRYRADDPGWAGRDRFVLSKGHGCLALYAILADKGFFPMEELLGFCRPTSRLGGHPERGKVPGVEASTGALGHGLPIGVGMAAGLRMRRSDARVVVLTGDGEINEGSNWEAAMSASKHRLANLTVMVDYNKLQSYGPTREVLDLEPLVDKWRAFGFATTEVDARRRGRGARAARGAARRRPADGHRVPHGEGPRLPLRGGNPDWHHKSGLTEADIAQMYACLA